MTGGRSLVAALAIACAAAVATAAAPRAAAGGEGSNSLPVGRQDPATGRRSSVDASVFFGPASHIGSGWGFARVDLENHHHEAHDVTVSIGSLRSSSLDVRATRVVRVEAKSRARVFMPRAPNTHDTLRVAVGRDYADIDESGRATGAVVALFVGFSSPAVGALSRGKTDYAAMLETAARHVISMTSTSGAPLCAVEESSVEDLPPSWTYLTAASLILVDGAAKGLGDVERQRTLLEFARAGGTLALMRRDALPRGPLSDLLASAPNGAIRGQIGLGRWFSPLGGSSASRPPFSEEAATAVAAVWMHGQRPAAASTVDREDVIRAGSIVPFDFAIEEAISGLARVPARLFFFLLLGFAVLVGPVAYVTLKRRRRLTAMLVVVPVTGLSFATAILAYGLIVEGLGTRGVVTTVTVLDQREHVATCAAGRTLFSGWSPSSIRISPDTVLYAPSVPTGRTYFGFGSQRASRARFDLDADAGRLDGTLLPSRTVTAFATVTSGRARERIRLRRRADGGYDVLAADGFGPTDESHALVFRAADGAYYSGGRSSTSLEPITAAEAEALLEIVRGAVTSVIPAEDDDPSDSDGIFFVRRPRGSRWWGDDEPPVPEDRATLAERALGGEIPPSSYVAWTTRAPGFDGLGIDVEWKRARHLVLGRLAPDDVEGTGK